LGVQGGSKIPTGVGGRVHLEKPNPLAGGNSISENQPIEELDTRPKGGNPRRSESWGPPNTLQTEEDALKKKKTKEAAGGGSAGPRLRGGGGRFLRDWERRKPDEYHPSMGGKEVVWPAGGGGRGPSIEKSG